VVKQVKRFDSDLEGRTLGELRVLLQREIKVVDARAMYGVTTGIAISPERDPGGTPGNRAAKAAGIEPVVGFAVKTGSARIQRGYAGNHLLRIVLAGVEAKGIARERPEPGIGEAKRESSLERSNAGKLPSAKDAVRKRVGNVMQAGDCIDVADHDALTGIIAGIAFVEIGPQNVDSHAASTAEAAVFEAGAIVDSMAPGVAGDELQPVAHALGDVRLHGMVAGSAISELCSDAAKAIAEWRTLSGVRSQNCMRWEEEVLEGSVGFAGSRSRTGSLASSSDEVTLVSTIEVPPHCSNVTHTEHGIARELALSNQVEVHGIWRAQIGIIGVNAHRLKEGKVDGASHCRRRERELIGVGSNTGYVGEGIGKSGRTSSWRIGI